MFFFAGGAGARLLGFLHLPKESRFDCGLVFCPAFAEEKNCSQAIVAQAARCFARQGFPVLRFDYSGCGDSEGELEDFTLADWQRDIQAAISQLQLHAQVTQVALWGLRLGAGLALLEANCRAGAPYALLWQPVLHFTEYIHQFLRQRISAGLVQPHKDKPSIKTLAAQLQANSALEISGYTITKKLYESFLAIDETPAQLGMTLPLFLASISMLENSGARFQKFSEHVTAKGGRLHLTHIQNEPFWDRYWCWTAPELIQRTADWLTTTMHTYGSHGAN